MELAFRESTPRRGRIHEVIHRVSLSRILGDDLLQGNRSCPHGEALETQKALLVLDTLTRYGDTCYSIVKIGGGYGLFGEAMQELCGRIPTIIEPGPQLAAECRAKPLPVIQKFLEKVEAAELPSGPKAFLSFELFEHLHDPAKFLVQLNRLMAPADLFITTTLSGSGVDIQVLWERSKFVTPPHHLNFLNPQSIVQLLGRTGFESLEVTTRGKLDIDILANILAQVKDRFWRTFIAMASASERAEWQQLIAKSGWSSHMMACVPKALADEEPISTVPALR